MKDLNNYILEKLTINKDIEIEKSLKDLYSIGDRCLVLIHYTQDKKSSHPGFILIDAVEIKKMLKESFECIYLTHFSNRDTEEKLFFKHTYYQEKDFKFLRSYTRPGLKNMVLIPENECEKLLEYIEKNKRVCFYDLLRNNYSNHPIGENIIATVDHHPIIWRNIRGISSEKIEKLKEKIKERY